MLSLTELPVSEGDSGNIPSWVKERDDLLTTVESLKGLITHMQMKVEEHQRLRAVIIIIMIIILGLSVYPRAICAPADLRHGGLASAAAGRGAAGVFERAECTEERSLQTAGRAGHQRRHHPSESAGAETG